MIDRDTHHTFWGIVRHNWETLTPDADLDRRLGNAYFDVRVSGAAILQSLSGGQQVTAEAHERSMEGLAEAAEEHALGVEDIQRIMELHEPCLKYRVEQPILLVDDNFED